MNSKSACSSLALAALLLLAGCDHFGSGSTPTGAAQIHLPAGVYLTETSRDAYVNVGDRVVVVLQADSSADAYAVPKVYGAGLYPMCRPALDPDCTLPSPPNVAPTIGISSRACALQRLPCPIAPSTRAVLVSDPHFDAQADGCVGRRCHVTAASFIANGLGTATLIVTSNDGTVRWSATVTVGGTAHTACPLIGSCPPLPMGPGASTP